jgi:hypothetical protein
VEHAVQTVQNGYWFFRILDPAMEPSTPSERRLFERSQALKPGRIVFNRASSTITCTMRNHSDGGARLDVTSVLGIPDAFEFRLDGYPGRASRIVWRKAQAVGIEFTSF